ncbi:Glycosyltransferase [Sulfitobacter noctilucicola]|uniref:Glycosyltransferase involved in cell wall biosynthesis n=1 Tax=Sulfitobacter noctilucicola TaxID=1342301 RepID=A0A7W6M8H2_9RHOB|nr:glycosyltransferase [Sulfitobacter noctilucicola]KIN64481.1 Glycosyltransferase [Sulfitobacter noctilucicola]MBB4174360.1 glycosyltransferase involved in cell wall biosynthesis [Sulfitobacter noctilucicola]
MTDLPRVLHLVDDTTAGGVMRVLDFLQSDSELAKTANHEVVSVNRGRIIGNLGPAHAIVSHLAVSWRSLPSLVALRAMHPLTPLIHVEHSYTGCFVTHNVRHRGRFRTLLKTAYSCFNRVVCVSNGQADWMVAERLVHADKLSTIQSCVDLTAFRAIPAPAGPAHVFGAIGRLDDQKGFDTLIEAFRQCQDPNIELHIIGEGAQEPFLRSLALGDDRIVFRGFQANPIEALRSVDIVMMPSRWEAYGLVAIEALAAGRRLLCHDIDGLSDHAESGGVMLNTADTENMSAIIMQEAQSTAAMRTPSFVRSSARLENQFRACWRFLLSDVGVGARDAVPTH